MNGSHPAFIAGYVWWVPSVAPITPLVSKVWNICFSQHSLSLHKIGGLSDDTPRFFVPPILRQHHVLKPVKTPISLIPVYATCLVAFVLVLSFVAMPKVDNLAKGWIGSVATKTGATVLHATQMPTQHISRKEIMRVECDATIADIKMLPAFTPKRSLGCFGIFWKLTRICSLLLYTQMGRIWNNCLSTPPQPLTPRDVKRLCIRKI